MLTDAMTTLSEPRRVEILRLVWDQERSAGDIARHFPVTFGAVSQHLARLHQAGLVTRRRAGRQRFYRADRARLGPLATALEAMWRDQLAVLKQLAESEQARLDQPARDNPAPQEPPQ